MDQNEMSNLYRGPSIDASYPVSVYLAKLCQSRRFLEIDQSEKRIVEQFSGMGNFAMTIWNSTCNPCFSTFDQLFFVFHGLKTFFVCYSLKLNLVASIYMYV
jgi:hypothetical protein